MTIKQINKLALGTAQFGMSYGIANKTGQISSEEVEKILILAKSNQIMTLDTAMLYGESESILGQNSIDGFSVVTKLPEFPDNENNFSVWIESQVEASLNRLNISKLNALLLHNPKQLIDLGDKFYKKLCSLKSQGIIDAIGISVYGPEELDLLFHRFDFDLVQAPFSILDRRILFSGWLEKLKKMGVLLHVRSIFMQGLLLMSKSQRPKKFSRWESVWARLDDFLYDTEQTAMEACVRYPLSIQEIDKVIVGVDSFFQLNEIIESVSGPTHILPEDLHVKDEKLLNPSLWSGL